MAHLERRREVKRLYLLGNGVDNALPPVTGITAPKAASTVQYLSAIVTSVMHALRADQQARLLFVLLIRGKRHPESIHLFRGFGCEIAVVLLKIRGIVHALVIGTGD
jgi:hypothetical protein